MKKDKKNSKSNNKTNKTSGKFDFNNEIVIGLTRIEEEKPKKEKKNTKTKKEKKEKSNNKKAVKKNNKKNVKNQSKKKNKPEQTVEVSLDQQDIIIPKRNDKTEKKVKNKSHRTLKYSFLAVCIVAIIIATMMSPLFDIKEIEVEGNQRISSGEIINLSQIDIGQNIYRIGIRESKKSIKENPYIKSVRIKRKLPNKLDIIVEERKVNFMLEYGNGFLYINNQGYMLEVSETKMDVPIIQGAATELENFIPGNRMCIEDLEKMHTVIKIMEIADNNDIAHLVSKIDIANNQNYKLVFDSENKVAYLGDDTDLNTKMLSIKAILEKEKEVGGEIFVNMDLKNNYPTFRQSV